MAPADKCGACSEFFLLAKQLQVTPQLATPQHPLAPLSPCPSSRTARRALRQQRQGVAGRWASHTRSSGSRSRT